MTIKLVGLLAFAFIDLSIWATENIEVVSLNQGNCFYFQEDKSKIKLAMFGQKQAMIIEDEDIKNIITELKKDFPFTEAMLDGKKEYYLYCNNYGAYLNIKTDQFCAWSKFDTNLAPNNKANFIHFGQTEGENLTKNGPCFGGKLGEYLINFKSEIELQSLKDILAKMPNHDQFLELYKINNTNFKLVLKKSAFSETYQIKKEIELYLGQQFTNFRSIDLNSTVLGIGEYKQVFF